MTTMGNRNPIGIITKLDHLVNVLGTLVKSNEFHDLKTSMDHLVNTLGTPMNHRINPSRRRL